MFTFPKNERNKTQLVPVKVNTELLHHGMYLHRLGIFGSHLHLIYKKR